MTAWEVEPRILHGIVAMQPSKSVAHRSVICASLAQGDSMVRNIMLSDDIKATMQGMASLGFAQSSMEAEGLHIAGGNLPEDDLREVDCGESGSTLRFLLPLALIGGGPVLFRGRGRLMERPMQPYEALFASQGSVDYRRDAEGILVTGRLTAGDYRLPGDVSSQFITGLLLALPLLTGDSRILLSSALESRGYVDMTLQAMARHGITAAWQDDQILLVPGAQAYHPADTVVEGDYSHAAFFLVAGALGGDVTCTGLDDASLQGDRAIVCILRDMGAEISRQADGIRACGGNLHGVSVDVSQIPDLVPALAIAACGCRGETLLHHAARLRMKESDRLAAMTMEINRLGGNAHEGPDWLRIRGCGSLKGGACSSHGDHRIAMALAVAAAVCKEPLVMDDPWVVRKSAPDFWTEYASLGGNTHERYVG